MSKEIFKAAMDAIINGDAQQAADTARQGLDEGIAPLDLMDKGFTWDANAGKVLKLLEKV